MTRLLPLLALFGLLFPLLAPAAMAEEPTADDYIEMFKPLVGVWKTVSTVDGKTIEGTVVFRLSRTQKCLVSYGEGGVLPPREAIHGYDPVAKQWKITTYDADGGYCVEVLSVKDMKKGKTLGKGFSCTSQVVRHSKDGKKTTGSYTLRYIDYDKDRIELAMTDRKEDGQAQPDVKGVGERQQRRTRGAKQQVVARRSQLAVRGNPGAIPERSPSARRPAVALELAPSASTRVG